MPDPDVPFAPPLHGVYTYVFELPAADVRYLVAGPVALLDAIRSESPFTRDLSPDEYLTDRARFLTYLLGSPVADDATAVAEAFVGSGAVRYLGAARWRWAGADSGGRGTWTEVATGPGWSTLRRRRH